MEFRDKQLECVECHGRFVWTAAGQLYYHDHRLKNEPRHCKKCRTRQKELEPGGRERVTTAITCSRCGREATVHFRPTQGRPVLCEECFSQRAGAPASFPVRSSR